MTLDMRKYFNAEAAHTMYCSLCQLLFISYSFRPRKQTPAAAPLAVGMEATSLKEGRFGARQRFVSSQGAFVQLYSLLYLSTESWAWIYKYTCAQKFLACELRSGYPCATLFVRKSRSSIQALDLAANRPIVSTKISA